MNIRYPQVIEEELDDTKELISLNKDLLSQSPDDALNFNLEYLKERESELIVELNLSNIYYQIDSFDIVIKKEEKNSIIPLIEAADIIKKFQDLIYSLAESSRIIFKKAKKEADSIKEIRKCATLGVSKASKGSLVLYLKAIDPNQQHFGSYIKIATDKLNELILCKDNEELLKKQTLNLGQKPMESYKNFLKTISTNEVTFKIFTEVKPANYETQKITKEFADKVYDMIIQTNEEPKIKFEEIEGKLRVINGIKKLFTIKSKDKTVSIKFKKEFNNTIARKFEENVRVKVKVTEEFHELEDKIDEKRELVKFID